MVKEKGYSYIALATSFLAFSVIALGAFTRLIDAGLGCPDWPGCYGHLIAPLATRLNEKLLLQFPGTNSINYKAWAEMVHRYFAGCLSFFSLVIILLGFTKSLRRPSNVIFSLLLLALIIYQIILGQWTVTLKLWPIIVTQHLLGGFLILSILWLIYLNNSSKISYINVQMPLTTLRIMAVGGLMILLLQIVLGAWMSTNYASLSCPLFPFCTRENMYPLQWKDILTLLPAGPNYEGGVLVETSRQSIHMAHRFGATIFTIYIVAFSIYLLPKIKLEVSLAKAFYIILALLCLQLLIGMMNILFQLPLALAVLHNLIASLLLLAMITFIYKLVIIRYRPVL